MIQPKDITDDHQLRSLVRSTLSAFSTVDILVNNGGISSMKTTIPVPGAEKMNIAQLVPDLNVPITDAERNMILNMNVKAGYELNRLVIPHMIKK